MRGVRCEVRGVSTLTNFIRSRVAWKRESGVIIYFYNNTTGMGNVKIIVGQGPGVVLHSFVVEPVWIDNSFLQPRPSTPTWLKKVGVHGW